VGAATAAVEARARAGRATFDAVVVEGAPAISAGVAAGAGACAGAGVRTEARTDRTGSAMGMSMCSLPPAAVALSIEARMAITAEPALSSLATMLTNGAGVGWSRLWVVGRSAEPGVK
jgi:hypothetical protein